MLKSKLTHVLLACLLLTATNISHGQSNATFTFKLANSFTTSAGVFTQDGVLIKTLWSNVKYAAGTYTQTWDGTNDDNHLVSGGNYSVRVLANNVNYQWQGVIGNTSSALSGPTVNHAFQGMYGMAFTGSNAYYCTNYNEQGQPILTFNTKAPQAKTSLLTKGGATAFVTTDGNYVYWDATDANDTAKTFVYATKVSDNSEVTNFAFGNPVSVIYSRTYASAIDANHDANSRITGLAVQKTGKYLFVSHQHFNQIHVINKVTGALVNTITVASPKGLAVDNGNGVWVISGNSLLKYTVNTDGSFSAPVLNITSLAAPLAISVSPDDSTIAVADGGTSQQIKAFDAVYGTPLWVFGTAGGYATDPTVTNTKFYFADRDAVHTFLSYAPDGSLWAGDPGNCRALHFTAARAFIEQIMYLPHFYSSVADPNNSSRVFADFLEFKVDYSKPLSPTNGSWTLVKNWGYNVTPAYNDDYFILRGLTTLNNGHTYAFLRHTNNLALVELPASGPLRLTGIELPGLIYDLCQDGSLRTQSSFALGQPTVWTVQKLTGFNNLNNPIWAAATTLASTPPATAADPAYYGSGNSAVTSSGVVVLFDAGLPPSSSCGYHLGGVKTGSNKWLWRTAKCTFTNYAGAYPTDGAYDIGNGVQYAGSYTRTLGRTIIWGYHGEFWKNSEVNKWTHVYDDGLLIGQFGVASNSYTEAAPMMAGNAFAVSFVKDSLGNGYVYLNDESYHSGIHQWKVTGLNSIVELNVPVTLPVTNNGLLGQYFDGIDLNTFNLKTTQVDTVVNLAGNPAAGVVSNAANFSTRWSGFIKADSSETYTFYADVNKGVRLWVNGTLVINGWANTTATELSGKIALTAGQWYAIRMDYYNSTSASAMLSWAATGVAKEVIPSKNLYPADMPDTSTGVDLLQGLLSQNVLENNVFGWSRYPIYEDLTNVYGKWWSVKSGYDSYGTCQSADVYASYTQASGAYSISRDLGTNASLASWNLTGSISYFGNNDNDGLGRGGLYFDVLDAAGKIISRFYTISAYNPVDPVVTIYGNKAVLAQAGSSLLDPLTYLPQPICITATNDTISFKYGPYAAVKTSVFDSTSNWQNPKTMRVYFFDNGANYGHIIDIKTMRFSKVNGTAAIAGTAVKAAAVSINTKVVETPVFTVYPNPVQNVMQVQYPTSVGTGRLEIISENGKLLTVIKLVKSTTSASIDVHALTPGLYFVLYNEGNVTLTKKIIK